MVTPPPRTCLGSSTIPPFQPSNPLQRAFYENQILAADSILLPTTKKYAINVMENAWIHKFANWGNKVRAVPPARAAMLLRQALGHMQAMACGTGSPGCGTSCISVECGGYELGGRPFSGGRPGMAGRLFVPAPLDHQRPTDRCYVCPLDGEEAGRPLRPGSSLAYRTANPQQQRRTVCGPPPPTTTHRCLSVGPTWHCCSTTAATCREGGWARIFPRM